MLHEPAAVVVAFDGSTESRAAVRAAATLLAGRRLLIVSVWEPGLGMTLTTPNDPGGLGSLAYVAPAPEDVLAIDRAQHDHAMDVAVAGAQIAREAGAWAEPLAVADTEDVAGTIIGVAEEHHAGAIAVGSRGRGRVRSMFGSTSQALLHRAASPVLVVRVPD